MVSRRQAVLRPLRFVAAIATFTLTIRLWPVRAQDFQFHAGVELVALHVAVTDTGGHFVRDLGVDDFTIFEDGREQKVVLFEPDSVPVIASLLLDTSDSMSPCLRFAQQAASGFVRGLGQDDLMAVVPFEGRVRAAQSFTGDPLLLEQAIWQAHAGGSTALYDTVYVALKELRNTAAADPARGPRRQALLLLTDGADSASLTSFEDVLDLAIHSDVAIYTIALPGATIPQVKSESPEFVLAQLARQTGGRSFHPEKPSQLDGIYRQIKSDLASQYLFGYRSDRHDGRFHQITVQVGRHGLAARTRLGYFADNR